jgi:hypothetical protein
MVADHQGGRVEGRMKPSASAIRSRSPCLSSIITNNGGRIHNKLVLLLCAPLCAIALDHRGRW